MYKQYICESKKHPFIKISYSAEDNGKYLLSITGRDYLSEKNTHKLTIDINTVFDLITKQVDSRDIDNITLFAENVILDLSNLSRYFIVHEELINSIYEIHIEKAYLVNLKNINYFTELMFLHLGSIPSRLYIEKYLNISNVKIDNKDLHEIKLSHNYQFQYFPYANKVILDINKSGIYIPDYIINISEWDIDYEVLEIISSIDKRVNLHIVDSDSSRFETIRFRGNFDKLSLNFTKR